MITNKTVFILGAGASAPYYYPVGSVLRRQICDSFHSELHKCITGSPFCGVDESPVEVQKSLEFTNRFHECDIKSIDRFLAINPDFSEMGKIAIALFILNAEVYSSFDETRDDHWYFHLFNKMVDTFNDPDSYMRFGDNKVIFITFNYDRSLEYYLHKSLRNLFPGKIPEDEIVKQLKRIPIYHVYGQVDHLP